MVHPDNLDCDESPGEYRWGLQTLFGIKSPVKNRNFYSLVTSSSDRDSGRPFARFISFRNQTLLGESQTCGKFAQVSNPHRSGRFSRDGTLQLYVGRWGARFMSGKVRDQDEFIFSCMIDEGWTAEFDRLVIVSVRADTRGWSCLYD